MASVLRIADASKVIREALGRWLGSIGGIGTVIYASSLDLAFEQTAAHQPNILVMVLVAGADLYFDKSMEHELLLDAIRAKAALLLRIQNKGVIP